MAIIATDLKLRDSERMADSASTVLGVGGGGRMGHLVIDGTPENDVFPDVMPGDRVAGKTQFRKVFLSPMSQDSAVLSNAGACILARPTDADCRMMLIGATTNDLQHQALTRVRAHGASVPGGGAFWGSTVGSSAFSKSGGSTVQLGDLVIVKATVEASAESGTIAYVTAIDSTTFTVSGGPYGSGYVACQALRGADATSFLMKLSVAASAGATSLTVDRVLEKFDQASSSYGIAGQRPGVFPGDVIVVSEGSTHEFVTATRANYTTGVITLGSALVNAFTTAATASVLTPLGNLQASVTLAVFSQQTWQRIWADTVTTPISATYSGVVALENAGATTDRWAVVFTSTTEFDLYSERLGLLVSGNTSTDFIPVNPDTNRPYFTLAASGWGSGWLPGNCIRFNTGAAAGAFWVVRCVLAGSSGGGTVNASIGMTGDVDG